MYNNTVKQYKEFMLRLLFLFAIIFSACAQTPQVKSIATTTVSNQDKINWWEDKTDFSLPFTVVYGGAKIPSSDILQKGFSHIAFGSDMGTYRQEIPVSRRAFLWTGIAYHDRESPWAKDKSPWGNDLNFLKNKWSQKLKKRASLYGEKDDLLRVDLVALDIEADLKNEKILSLKNRATTPMKTRQSSNKAFIKSYEQAMSDLYNEPLLFLKENVQNVNKIGSYGDVPIARTWHEIDDYSWSEWQNNSQLTDYLGTQSSFANGLNTLTPSAYFFYEKGQNLAYCLFQIEANAAWSEKQQILFLSPRYVGKGIYGKPLATNLAEAMAIFPFFSGAEGIWFWETSKDRKELSENIEPVYRSFHTGLHRLSAYSDFFTGNFTRIIPDSAHKLFIEKKVIWRGIEKDNKILVVAQNPYAKPQEKTSLSIEYKYLKTELQLTGQQIIFQVFDL